MKLILVFICLISLAHAETDCSDLLSAGMRLEASIRDLSALRYELDLRNSLGLIDLPTQMLRISYDKKFQELSVVEPELEIKLREEIKQIQEELAEVAVKRVQRSASEDDEVRKLLDSVSVIGHLREVRNGAGQEMLSSGKILLMGSDFESSGFSITTELFNPTTGKSVKRVPMSNARAHLQFSRLLDDTVLIGGGTIRGKSTNELSIFNPRKNTILSAGNLQEARARHAQVTLPNGKVLFIGGIFYRSGDVPSAVTSIELYDPRTQTSEVIADEPALVSNTTCEVLSDGTVVANNGHSVYLIDPSQKKVVLVAQLQQPRANFAQSMTADGKLIVSGGRGIFGVRDNQFLNEIEMVDLVAKTSQVVAHFQQTRCYHRQVTLLDGRIAFIGGVRNFEKGGGYYHVETLDAATGQWVSDEQTKHTRTGHRLFLQKDGSVLVVGGLSRDGNIDLTEVEKIKFGRK